MAIAIIALCLFGGFYLGREYQRDIHRTRDLPRPPLDQPPILELDAIEVVEFERELSSPTVH
jgi:hypothetical protein